MGWSDSEVIKIVWEVRGVATAFESFLTLAWYLSLYMQKSWYLSLLPLIILFSLYSLFFKSNFDGEVLGEDDVYLIGMI